MAGIWRILPYLVGAVAVIAVASTWFQEKQTLPPPPPDGVRVDPPRMQPGATVAGPAVEYRLENHGWTYTVTATNRDAAHDLCFPSSAFDRELDYTPFQISGPEGSALATYPVASVVSGGPPERLKPGQSISQTWDLDQLHDLRGIGAPVTVTFFAPFYECEDPGL